MFRWIHDTYRLTYMMTLLYDIVGNAEPCTSLMNISNIDTRYEIAVRYSAIAL